MIENDNNFKFKKIFGLIPNDLFEELKSKNKFEDGNWDSFLANAITDKLNGDDK